MIRNPDHCCAICGKYLKAGEEIEHRCRQSVLNAIDAADSRAYPEPGNEPLADESRRSEAERLHAGLAEWDSALEAE